MFHTQRFLALRLTFPNILELRRELARHGTVPFRTAVSQQLAIIMDAGLSLVDFLLEIFSMQMHMQQQPLHWFPKTIGSLKDRSELRCGAAGKFNDSHVCGPRATELLLRAQVPFGDFTRHAPFRDCKDDQGIIDMNTMLVWVATEVALLMSSSSGCGVDVGNFLECGYGRDCQSVSGACCLADLLGRASALLTMSMQTQTRRCTLCQRQWEVQLCLR